MATSLPDIVRPARVCPFRNATQAARHDVIIAPRLKGQPALQAVLRLHDQRIDRATAIVATMVAGDWKGGEGKRGAP